MNGRFTLTKKIPALFAVACILLALPFAAPISLLHADSLTLVINGQERQLEGDILIEAQDESLYFRENTGHIWFVKPEQVKAKVDVEATCKPISKKELGKRLLEELPEGFRVFETEHYVIAYQNEYAYAKWIGNLYEERLYRAFDKFWKRKKFDLESPAYPLVAIVFGSKAAYDRYKDRELGPGQEMVAYYNVQNNRVAMYDLTVGNVPAGKKLDERRIAQVFQNPAAINMVATVIHEGTHQLLFNRGVQTRFADCPLWINEGLAMYFEAPDLGNKRGWKKPGLVFEQRLFRFIDFAKRRPANSLASLISDDDRLRDADTALDAYAEAWAFNHFLLNRRTKEYVDYLRHMATKEPLEVDGPEARLKEFKKFFGDDFQDLNEDFLKYVAKMR